VDTRCQPNRHGDARHEGKEKKRKGKKAETSTIPDFAQRPSQGTRMATPSMASFRIRTQWTEGEERKNGKLNSTRRLRHNHVPAGPGRFARKERGEEKVDPKLTIRISCSSPGTPPTRGKKERTTLASTRPPAS